jgi:formate-dependent nitrite reductase membrane component NrfD
MISWGVLILSVFIPVAILYAAALNDIPILGKFAARYEKALLVIGSILAICTAGYTGVLIAVVNGVPFWNTPLMPVLFLASAVSTGLAGSAILASIMDAKSIKNMSNFAYGHMIFLILEAVVLVLFIVMSATRSTETAFSAGLLISGVLSPYFWLFVVFLGILVPLVISAVEYFQLKHLPKALILTVDACVLLGGLSLRAVIVFSGVAPQIL